MKAFRLFRAALDGGAKTVLDVGCGPGNHAKAFISKGCKVSGLDIRPAEIEHDSYTHYQTSYEKAEIDEQFDAVWCSHVLEHVPNSQYFLGKLRGWTSGYLAIAVPSALQNRLHIGHVSLWTPAHLIYNLVCAGWDCRRAQWYTEYSSIGLIVPKEEDIDFSERTGMPSEEDWFNQYTPFPLKHMHNAWLENNWHEETEPRRLEPVPISTGQYTTNIPSESPLVIGPNPTLRDRL